MGRGGGGLLHPLVLFSQLIPIANQHTNTLLMIIGLAQSSAKWHNGFKFETIVLFANRMSLAPEHQQTYIIFRDNNEIMNF